MWFRFKVSSLVLLTLILCISFKSLDCANILGFFPIPYFSHQSHHFGLLKALADRGHQLTVFTTHLFDYNNANVTQIHLDESVGINKRIVNQHSHSKKSVLGKSLTELQLHYELTKYHLKNQQIQKLIAKGRRNDFDLILFESYVNHPLMALSDLFDCPIIVSTAITMPFPMMDFIGAETNPTIYPEHTLTTYRDGDLTFLQRLHSITHYYGFRFFIHPTMEFINSFLSYRHLRGITYSRRNVENRIAMLFTNYLTVRRPMLPNTIPLNFLHVYRPKALPDGDVKTFLDTADNGVILMSLGSYAQSTDLNPQSVNALLKVFESLPYRILWKFEGELSNKSSNVMIVKWLKQCDVLAHPNLKLFITHGGLMSVQESIDREIPMLIIPITYDQPANAVSLVAQGVAVSLNFDEIAEDSLKSSIEEIMKPKYRTNVKRLKTLMQDKPISDRDLGVWNVEYVIRNGGADFLRSNVRSVPVYQKLHLDVILLIVAVAYITFKAMKNLSNRIGSSQHSMEATKLSKLLKSKTE